MESLWVHYLTCNNQSWKDHFKEALYEDSHFLDRGGKTTLKFSEVFDIESLAYEHLKIISKPTWWAGSYPIHAVQSNPCKGIGHQLTTAPWYYLWYWCGGSLPINGISPTIAPPALTIAWILILILILSSHLNGIRPTIAPPALAIALILMELQKVADIPNVCTNHSEAKQHHNLIWMWLKADFCGCWNPEILKTISWREIEFQHIWGNIYPIICKIHYFRLEQIFLILGKYIFVQGVLIADIEGGYWQAALWPKLVLHNVRWLDMFRPTYQM